jgi:hypothetical protein
MFQPLQLMRKTNAGLGGKGMGSNPLLILCRSGNPHISFKLRQGAGHYVFYDFGFCLLTEMSFDVVTCSVVLNLASILRRVSALSHVL